MYAKALALIGLFAVKLKITGINADGVEGALLGGKGWAGGAMHSRCIVDAENPQQLQVFQQAAGVFVVERDGGRFHID